jgi:hypothetical protein
MEHIKLRIICCLAKKHENAELTGGSPFTLANNFFIYRYGSSTSALGALPYARTSLMQIATKYEINIHLGLRMRKRECLVGC